MNVLTILGRSNWTGGFYLKFKAEEKSIKIIKKLAEKLGSEYFVDNQTIPRTFSKYEKWKDKWIPISGKGFSVDIICGDKVIHVLVNSKTKLDFVTKVLNEYSKWAEIKYKKGLELKVSNNN